MNFTVSKYRDVKKKAKAMSGNKGVVVDSTNKEMVIVNVNFAGTVKPFGRIANTAVADLRINAVEKFSIKKSNAKTSIMPSYTGNPLTSGRKTLVGMSFQSVDTLRMRLVSRVTTLKPVIY